MIPIIKQPVTRGALCGSTWVHYVSTFSHFLHRGGYIGFSSVFVCRQDYARMISMTFSWVVVNDQKKNRLNVGVDPRRSRFHPSPFVGLFLSNIMQKTVWRIMNLLHCSKEGSGFRCRSRSGRWRIFFSLYLKYFLLLFSENNSWTEKHACSRDWYSWVCAIESRSAQKHLFKSGFLNVALYFNCTTLNRLWHQQRIRASTAWHCSPDRD